MCDWCAFSKLFLPPELVYVHFRLAAFRRCSRNRTVTTTNVSKCLVVCCVALWTPWGFWELSADLPSHFHKTNVSRTTDCIKMDAKEPEMAFSFYATFFFSVTTCHLHYPQYNSTASLGTDLTYLPTFLSFLEFPHVSIFSTVSHLKRQMFLDFLSIVLRIACVSIRHQQPQKCFLNPYHESYKQIF